MEALSTRVWENARAARPAGESLRGGVQHRWLLLVYEAVFDQPANTLRLERPILGARAPLANGKVDSYDYDKTSNSFIFSFSTATSPTQIFTVGGQENDRVVTHTRERVLGIAADQLSRARMPRSHPLTVCASPRACIYPLPPWASRVPAAGVLHTRRAAEPGAPRLCLVLHAADPVSSLERLRGVCPQRAR